MNNQEKAIILAIIKRALADGCVCSVQDGEEYTVKESRNPEEIIKGLGHCEEEWLELRNNIGRKRVGSVYFVYGNEPEEVVADYSWSMIADSTGSRMKTIVDGDMSK